MKMSGASPRSLSSKVHCHFCSNVYFWVALRTAGLILLYYCLSIGLTFYQNWVLKQIHFPLLVVACHSVVKFLLAFLCRCSWQCYTGKSPVTVEWGPYVKKLAPTGIASVLDIGLSNWSLELITVSLYTMSKSTAIIFILIFALIFKLEKIHWTLVVTVLMISGGLIMFTYKSTQFNLKGFLLVMTASLLSGLRWTLAQLVMQNCKLGLNNPIHMVYHVQPWMILVITPLAMGFEGNSLLENWNHFDIHKPDAMVHWSLVILIGAFLAFLMEVAEFLVVTYTSSLTLSIAGIFKEICTLGLAIVVTGDQIGLVNFFGLLICLGGITFHVVFKALYSEVQYSKRVAERKKDEENGSSNQRYSQLPLLHQEGGSGNEEDNDEEEEMDVLFTAATIKR